MANMRLIITNGWHKAASPRTPPSHNGKRMSTEELEAEALKLDPKGRARLEGFSQS